jgi:hypothetical protein
MAEFQPSKLAMRVRFPSPAPNIFAGVLIELQDASGMKDEFPESMARNDFRGITRI